MPRRACFNCRVVTIAMVLYMAHPDTRLSGSEGFLHFQRRKNQASTYPCTNGDRSQNMIKDAAARPPFLPLNACNILQRKARRADGRGAVESGRYRGHLHDRAVSFLPRWSTPPCYHALRPFKRRRCYFSWTAKRRRRRACRAL